ncbi:hypothetical protein [Streptomyces sp. 1331.2]|uniref:hypothetical protein n=1 Tax=Streptomyces sp. 1331.2 TaxID=1938835 RepID=UPI000BE2FDCA|nr:hypothetical protein [Streptomyces sp. 1331.2]
MAEQAGLRRETISEAQLGEAMRIHGRLARISRGLALSMWRLFWDHQALADRTACALLEQALDQSAVTWYAPGMERVRKARRALAPWQESAAIQHVDRRLYSWSATLSSLQR